MSPPFWDPWYRQAGGSLFTPGRRDTRAQAFGNPDTGRSGIPAFTPPAEVFSSALIKLWTFGQMVQGLVLPPRVIFPY